MNEQKVDKMKCPVCGTKGEASPASCPRCALVDELIEELIRKQSREGWRSMVSRPKPILSLWAVETGAR